LKNIPEKKYLHFIILFPLLTFFLLYEYPKGTKIGTKHKNPLFFKKWFMQEVLDLLQKFNKCCKKNFQQFFVT